MRKLISRNAIIIAELNISMGAPTIHDIANLLRRGKYTLEVSDPLDNILTIILKEKQ